MSKYHPRRTAAQIAANRRGEGEKWCFACQAKHPMAAFGIFKSTIDGHDKMCKKSRIPAKRRATLRPYGLTTEQYERLLAVQGGLCAICQKPEKAVDKRTGKTRRLAVDHDAKIGPTAVRGLLCSACNQGVGYFKDSRNLMRSAGIYLAAGSYGVTYAVQLGRGLRIVP